MAGGSSALATAWSCRVPLRQLCPPTKRRKPHDSLSGRWTGKARRCSRVALHQTMNGTTGITTMATNATKEPLSMAGQMVASPMMPTREQSTR